VRIMTDVYVIQTALKRLLSTRPAFVISFVCVKTADATNMNCVVTVHTVFSWEHFIRAQVLFVGWLVA
jgi:hypothetical protein